MSDEIAKRAAYERLTKLEARIANALESQFGSGWWMQHAHPQTQQDYIRADDSLQRAACILTMMQDRIRDAIGCWQALNGAGIE